MKESSGGRERATHLRQKQRASIAVRPLVGPSLPNSILLQILLQLMNELDVESNQMNRPRLENRVERFDERPKRIDVVRRVCPVGEEGEFLGNGTSGGSFDVVGPDGLVSDHEGGGLVGLNEVVKEGCSICLDLPEDHPEVTPHQKFFWAARAFLVDPLVEREPRVRCWISLDIGQPSRFQCDHGGFASTWVLHQSVKESGAAWSFRTGYPLAGLMEKANALEGSSAGKMESGEAGGR